MLKLTSCPPSAYTSTCVLPLGVESAENAFAPSNNKLEPSEEKVDAELVPQVSLPEDTAQSPLLLFSVKLSAEPEAVKVAQVPLVYHVPLLMMHPFLLPPVTTLR